MSYDLVLSGATIIDPAQNLNAVLDVAISDGRIAAVEAAIGGPAVRRIDLSGKILTPGWIDIHAHVFAGATTWGICADALCLATGVTTIVDAGSPGWANFLAFKEFVAAPARTQILTFVHISGIGLTYGPLGELEDIRYADAERAAYIVEQWPEICVGIKVRQGAHQVGQNGVEPLRIAVEAGGLCQAPVMCHIGAGVPLAQVLELMRPQDIITHCFQGIGDTILDGADQVLPQVWAARQRGVLFDLGHGGGSFQFGVAKKALAQGFVSDVISTDIHSGSLESPVHSLPETASKMLNLGMDLEEVVRQTTAAPAAAIGRSDQLGTLAVGTVADLAAFEVRQGNFEFTDVRGQVEVGPRMIQPVLTLRQGREYRPAELAEEMEETRRRARQIRAIGSKDFALAAALEERRPNR